MAVSAVMLAAGSATPRSRRVSATAAAADFTAAVAAEVAQRLARGEGRPAAHTPGALFGPALALAAGGEFLIDQT